MLLRVETGLEAEGAGGVQAEWTAPGQTGQGESYVVRHGDEHLVHLN